LPLSEFLRASGCLIVIGLAGWKKKEGVRSSGWMHSIPFLVPSKVTSFSMISEGVWVICDTLCDGKEIGSLVTIIQLIDNFILFSRITEEGIQLRHINAIITEAR